MMNGYRPQNISELKQVLKDPKGKMIAGGTDEVIQMYTFHRIPSELVYLGAIPELREIREEENSIFVGACCTHHMVAENELVKKHAGALHDACSDIGSPQIRNNGTIGGNIANASPAGDGLPVMWLLDPEIEILGPDGTRMTRMKDLLLGPGKTSLDYNEVIVGFHIRKRPENVINHFHKLGFRKRVTIARIGMDHGPGYSSRRNRDCRRNLADSERMRRSRKGNHRDKAGTGKGTGCCKGSF